MPYSIPATPPLPLPIHSQGRPTHRRSYSDTRSPGAFAPLSLPRRKDSSSSSSATTPDSDADDDDDKYIPNIPPTLRLKPNNSLKLNLSLTHNPIPFPRSSPSPSPLSPPPTPTLTPPPPPPRPTVPRTSSTPILLSNGKPLKSSLKFSSSSPNIPSSPQLQLPSNTNITSNHTRARSAPASPFTSSSPPPPTPKNVHFPSKEQGGLETIRLFNRSAKPASLSRSRSASTSAAPDDTETETETEGYSQVSSRSGFPFPRVLPTLPRKVYDLAPETSSLVPAADPSPYANVLLESLALSNSPSALLTETLTLTGTLLVRNLAYEKTVAVRFTLDEWHTTSEVAARHLESLLALPEEIFRAGSGLGSSSGMGLGLGLVLEAESNELPAEDSQPTPTPTPKDPAWDRFKFTIHLEDYAPTLERRTMWLVARYVIPNPPTFIPLLLSPFPDAFGLVDNSVGTGAGGEWWDNNGGGNYRVGFRVREEVEGNVGEERERIGTRRTAVSAPSSFLTAPPPSVSLPSASTFTTTPHPATPIPHPNSPQNFALAQTTLSRLRKLSLKNYAAPAPPVVSPDTSPVEIKEKESENTLHGENDGKHSHPHPSHVEGWEFEMVGGYLATTFAAPASASSEVKPKPTGDVGLGQSVGPAFAASTSPPGVSLNGNGVYWSWGSSSPPLPVKSEKEDGEGNEKDKDKESPVPEQLGDVELESESEVDMRKPRVIVTAPTPTKPPTPTTLTPTPAITTTAKAKAKAPPGLSIRLPHVPQRHPQSYAPRRSSPLASPRGSPPGSPLPLSVPSPLGSGSGTVSPVSPRRSMESIPEEFIASKGGKGRGRRVFSPETDVRRVVPPTPVSVLREEETIPSVSVIASDASSTSASASSSASMSRSSSPSASPAHDFPSTTVSSNSPSLDTDSVYQAFVRKWCFAGCPSPSPSLSSSPGSEVELGVRVGFEGNGVKQIVTPRLGVSPWSSEGELGVYRGHGRERVIGF